MARAGRGARRRQEGREQVVHQEGKGEEADETSLRAAQLPPALRDLIVAYGQEASLAEEIGALRAVLAQLLATGGGDTAALSQSVPRVVNAIVRALRTQRVLAGESVGDLNEIATRILAEIGYGNAE